MKNDNETDVSKDVKNNLETWDKLKEVPEWAKKKITGGRLKGFTDIKPQWRYQRMTEIFGICGVGWKYDIMASFKNEACDGQIAVFIDIRLYVKVDGEWSDGIPGTGGSMLVAKEKGGLHATDECYKMALTDALGVAMKMLGLASDVYMGFSDSKNSPDAKKPEPVKKPKGILIAAYDILKKQKNTADLGKEFINLGQFEWTPEETDKIKITYQDYKQRFLDEMKGAK